MSQSSMLPVGLLSLANIRLQMCYHQKFHSVHSNILKPDSLFQRSAQLESSISGPVYVATSLSLHLL